MKVIFDISTVNPDPSKRTGLARVSWTLAKLLHEELGDNISFSAIGSLSASLQIEKLLKSNPHLKTSIVPVEGLPKIINSQYEKVIDYESSTKAGVVKQFFLKNLSRLINVTRQSISYESLRECDIFHSSYPRIPKFIRQELTNRHLQTVYDLIPLILDNKYLIPGQTKITQRIIDSIQPNDWITTISDSTRNDLLNRIPNLDEKRVVTIYLGADKNIFHKVTDKSKIKSIKNKYGISHQKNYFLSLNSLLPHKNISHLITSFNELIKQERISDLSLVICGGSKSSIHELVKHNNFSSSDLENVHFTGFVEETDLASLYSGSLAFIFPSLYEGFGLPVLEAMQCGCPIICSNSSSLPEIVENAGFLVSPTNISDLCHSMLCLYNSSHQRSIYSDLSLDRSKVFTWKKTVKELLELYKLIHD